MGLHRRRDFRRLQRPTLLTNLHFANTPLQPRNITFSRCLDVEMSFQISRSRDSNEIKDQAKATPKHHMPAECSVEGGENTRILAIQLLLQNADCLCRL